MDEPLEHFEVETGARQSLAAWLRIWVSTHPDPDLPALTAMGRDFTSKDILEEVSRGTPFGDHFTHVLTRAANERNTEIGEFVRRAIAVNIRG